jgi:hypothetical protein
MSIFICCECDNYADCDDGCDECKEHENGLICVDCVDNTMEDEDE